MGTAQRVLVRGQAPGPWRTARIRGRTRRPTARRLLYARANVWEGQRLHRHRCASAGIQGSRRQGDHTHRAALGAGVVDKGLESLITASAQSMRARVQPPTNRRPRLRVGRRERVGEVLIADRAWVLRQRHRTQTDAGPIRRRVPKACGGHLRRFGGELRQGKGSLAPRRAGEGMPPSQIDTILSELKGYRQTLPD